MGPRDADCGRAALVLAALVNLPLVHSDLDRPRASSGPASTYEPRWSTIAPWATEHLVSFTFPDDIDPDQRTWRLRSTRRRTTAPSTAPSSRCGCSRTTRAAYRVLGQVETEVVLIATLVADALLLAIGLLWWRFRGRGHAQLRAIAVQDVERCKPERVLEQVEGETYLIRGEVTTIAPGMVVLDVGDQTVLVHLDGHRNPVGYQQPAQVRARLLRG